MTDIMQARNVVVAPILAGEGHAARDLRRAALDNARLPEAVRPLIDNVARHAYQVTDADIAAARASGLSEDQIFEIVICAAIGQASRQYHSALAALEA